MKYNNQHWIGYDLRARVCMKRLDDRRYKPRNPATVHWPLWMQMCKVHGEAQSRGARLHRNNRPVK